MRTKVYNSSIANSGSNVVAIEERYDSMAISQGLFVAVYGGMAKTIECVEVGSMSTANYLFDSFVNEY